MDVSYWPYVIADCVIGAGFVLWLGYGAALILNAVYCFFSGEQSWISKDYARVHYWSEE